jgi:uroporphyrin-III C-methyltransferase
MALPRGRAPMNAAAIAALLAETPRMAPGEVWLAGAGPGDPAQLTLEVLGALGQADVIIHDALIETEVLALARPGAELVFLGKRGGRPSPRQAEITARLVAEARAGRRVLRLKGGDPFVFGRGGEEAVALAAAGIGFRVLPGLTAGLVAMTAALIPATMRETNQAVILATGHGAAAGGGPDWPALARTGQPILLYMATRTLPAIVAGLMAGGLPPDTPAAVVVGATTPDQAVIVTRLDALAGMEIPSPAIIGIGAIVALRARLLAEAQRLLA